MGFSRDFETYRLLLAGTEIDAASPRLDRAAAAARLLSSCSPKNQGGGIKSVAALNRVVSGK